MSAISRSTRLEGLPSSMAHDKPKPGGFGKFSAMYRARWSLSYPNMRARWTAASVLQQPALAIEPEELRPGQDRQRHA